MKVTIHIEEDEYVATFEDSHGEEFQGIGNTVANAFRALAETIENQ